MESSAQLDNPNLSRKPAQIKEV